MGASEEGVDEPWQQMDRNDSSSFGGALFHSITRGMRMQRVVPDG